MRTEAQRVVLAIAVCLLFALALVVTEALFGSSAVASLGAEQLCERLAPVA